MTIVHTIPPAAPEYRVLSRQGAGRRKVYFSSYGEDEAVAYAEACALAIPERTWLVERLD